MSLQNIFNTLLNNTINEKDSNYEISSLIFIANINKKHLDPLEIQTASKLCSHIYKNLYSNDLTKLVTFIENNQFILQYYHVNICNKSLWNAIWIYSLKHFEVFQLKNKNVDTNNYSEFMLWCVYFILNNLNVLDKNSLYLLRSLQLILNKFDKLSCTLSFLIIKYMRNVCLSPLIGFKTLAHNISKTCLQFLNAEQRNQICELTLLPFRGIDSYDVIQSFTEIFVKSNLEIIIAKVLFMFSNNIENKDAGVLYGSAISVCEFNKWIEFVWPLFFQKLQDIEYEGELFQSIVKHWIPASVNVYKADFYYFIKIQKIDVTIKAQVLLECRKKGFECEEKIATYQSLESLDLVLKLVSTYRRKTLRPSPEEIDIFMNYLYGNLKTYLENDEIDNINKFFSQMVYVAHRDLLKSDQLLNFYISFVNQILNFSRGCFYTEFFEVGAQILHHILAIITGSSKELQLLYKLEKKDMYERRSNMLYLKIMQRNLWNYKDIFHIVYNCLSSKDFSSLILTNLLIEHNCQFRMLTVNMFDTIFKKVEVNPCLKNSEKIINCLNLLFSQLYEETVHFLEEIEERFLDKLKNRNINESELFKNILYFDILTVAQSRHLKINNVHEIIKETTVLIDHIIESGFLIDISYRCKKVVETFITRLMVFLEQNIQSLWRYLDVDFTILTLIKIIQKSNMKKPVSLSTELLRVLGCKLEENELGQKMKIQLLNKTLQTITETPMTNYLKIRRNPESRLVIHAMCVSQIDSQKSLLHWTVLYLLQIMKNPTAADLSVSSSLHSIELLISDNRLQNQTLSYIPEIITQCVELFKRPNWIVRNADLQLAKSLIERLYGISMHNYYRPKNISDLFDLYPSLSSYFFQVLSTDKLDERAVIVFQFFFESHIKDIIFKDENLDIMDYFQILLIHIIKTYGNHYGKLAVKSFVAICPIELIPTVFLDLTTFIQSNFVKIPKNIFFNMILLLEGIYEKYKNSYYNCINRTGIKEINSNWISLTNFLKKIDTKLFDYLLIKVKSIDDILSLNIFDDNLWIHNNLTFLFLNGTSDQICELLNNKNILKAPEFFQMKMLSILIQRYENNEFNSIENITNLLFFISFSIEKYNYYLLTGYFKCLVIFQKNVNIQVDLNVSASDNLYKNLLQLLYITKKTNLIIENQFFSLILNQFKNSILINEDCDNDIISILSLSYGIFPKDLRVDIFKILFNFSILKSTYLETYRCICKITNRSYKSFLDAFVYFFGQNNLKESLSDKNINELYKSIHDFLLNDFNRSINDDEFYEIDDEVMIPKTIIKKVINWKII